MQSLAAVITIGLAVLCRADITVMMMMEAEHPMMAPMCMSHCSYVCMASAGKVEACAVLLSPSNETVPSLPDLASCPADTKPVEDCFMKCGCQCTRCGVCLMKNMNPMAARDACQANPDPMKCMMDKRNEVLKACN